MQKIVKKISKHFGLEVKPSIQGKNITVRIKEINTIQLEMLASLLVRQPYSYHSLAKEVDLKRSGPGLIVIIQTR